MAGRLIEVCPRPGRGMSATTVMMRIIVFLGGFEHADGGLQSCGAERGFA